MKVTEEHLVVSRKELAVVTGAVIVTILTMATIAIFAAFERLGGAASADGRIVVIAAIAMGSILALTICITHIRSFRATPVKIETHG